MRRRLQVNVIATGLLAILLLPLLAKTAERFSSSDFKPHLTIVASEGSQIPVPVLPLDVELTLTDTVHAFAAYKEAKVPGSVLAALNTKEHYNSLDRFVIPLYHFLPSSDVYYTIDTMSPSVRCLSSLFSPTPNSHPTGKNSTRPLHDSSNLPPPYRSKPRRKLCKSRLMFF